MARRREASPPAADDDRGGWAHYDLIAPLELRFTGWCPDPAGPHGQCAPGVRHGWRSSEAALARLRGRGIVPR